MAKLYVANKKVRAYVNKYMKAMHMSPRAFDSIILSGLGYEGCTIYWGSCSNELVLVQPKNQYEQGPCEKLHIFLFDKENDASHRTNLGIPHDSERGYDFYEIYRGNLTLSVKERHYDNNDFSIRKVMDYRISDFTEILYIFETEKLSNNVIIKWSVKPPFEQTIKSKESEIISLLKSYPRKEELLPNGKTPFEKMFDDFKKIFYSISEVPFSFFTLEVTGGDGKSTMHQLLAKNGIVKSYTKSKDGVKYQLSSDGKWSSASEKWTLSVNDGNFDYKSSGRISDAGPNQNDVIKAGIEETQRMHKIMCW